MNESSFLNPTKVLAAAGLHEGMLVADFGTGSGFFARAAARLVGPEGAVWAVDADQGLLARVKTLSAGEGLHNVEVVRGNVEHIGGTHLPEGKFDAVIAANLLFGAECKSCLAKECARVLKKNGKVLVIDWSDSFGGLGPHPSHVVSQVAARKEFEAAGFVVAGELPSGAYHWGLIMRKK